jgi:CheY-like chemotaxis protein
MPEPGSLEEALERTRELEVIVERLGEELRVADERTTNLAGGIAHDLNNLFVGIRGHVALALTEEDPSEDLRQLERYAKRGTELVHQLLSIGRRHMLSPRIIDVRDELEGLVPSLKAVAGHRISVSTSCAPGDLRILMDPGLLAAILTSLATNAGQAMPNGGSLSLDATARPLPWDSDAAGVRIDVKDCGHGIEPDILGCIFEPFFTTRGAGSGLGLPMAQGAVRQSGGQLSVTSEVGSGTTFHIDLPAVRGDEVRPTSTRLRGLAYVAMADIPRVITAKVLTNAGFTVEVGESGGELLRRAITKAHQPVVLVVDEHLPGLGGLDLAERLLVHAPAMAVIVLAGYGRLAQERPRWRLLPFQAPRTATAAGCDR